MYGSKSSSGSSSMVVMLSECFHGYVQPSAVSACVSQCILAYRALYSVLGVSAAACHCMRVCMRGIMAMLRKAQQRHAGSR